MEKTGGILLGGNKYTIQRHPDLVDELAGFSDADIIQRLEGTQEFAALQNWANSIGGNAIDQYGSYLSDFGGGNRRSGNLFERDKYVTVGSIYDQFMMAERAADEDDVVSGVLESSTNLAFSKMKFDVPNEDQEDVWNQLAKLWDLDSRLREMWRDLFIYSQVVVGVYWGTKNFKIRGTTAQGKKKKKSIDGLRVPLGITLLDPAKIVPFGSFLFRKERLLYMVDATEARYIDDVLSGKIKDDPIKQLMVQKYQLTDKDQVALGKLGLNIASRYGSAYYILNPENVWRHTETRPDHVQFASLKMKSIFPLLDQKNLLRERDRTHLLADTNFIILIKKGSDRMPAKPNEMKSLAGQVKSLGRFPVLLGDHRLNIEIVTPKNDRVLASEPYDLIDKKITGRLYKLIGSGGKGNAGAQNDDSIKLARMVGKGLESSRHQLKRFIEAKIIEAILDKNPELDENPDLRFIPNRISPEFDQAFSAFALQLRQMGEISRETILTEFDFDQDDEARWLEEEEDNGYNDIFHTINPNNQGAGATDSPQQKPKEDPKLAGRTKGGASAGTGQGQPARNPIKKSD